MSHHDNSSNHDNSTERRVARTLSRRHWVATLSGALAGAYLSAGAAAARGQAPVQPASQASEWWALDTRTAGCNIERAQAYRSAGCGQPWNCATAADAFTALSADAGDPNVFTLIYVHGNRSTLQTGLDAGVKIHNAVKPYLQPHERLRLLTWCWPSDEIRGQLKDIRYKAQVSEGQFGLFADTLCRLPANARVGVIGYSYGARIALGALAQIAQRRRSGKPSPAPSPRMVLWAAALNAAWMAPGGRLSCSVEALDRLLVVRNTCDPALRNYFIVEGHHRGVRALGEVGFPWGCPAAEKCQELDGSGHLGNNHDVDNYLRSPTVISCTAHEVLWRA